MKENDDDVVMLAFGFFAILFSFAAFFLLGNIPTVVPFP